MKLRTQLFEKYSQQVLKYDDFRTSFIKLGFNKELTSFWLFFKTPTRFRGTINAFN